MQKKLLKCSVILACLAWMQAFSLDLVKDGGTDYVIVIGTNGVYDRFAASEFQEIMKRSTGADFKRVKSGSPEAASAKKRVLIGDSPEIRKLLDEKTIHGLVNHESLVTERGNDLLIIGGGNHGTAYGVYHFLEKEIGYRWFHPEDGGEFVPLHKNLTTAGKDLRRKIAFDFYRKAYMIYLYKPEAALYIYRNSGDPSPRFAERNKMKGLLKPDHIELDNGHGLFLYISNERYKNFYPWDVPTDYFKSNSEFFSMDRNGKRIEGMQLCFSNENLRKEFTKRILERGKRVGGKGYLTIGANDVPGSFCFCPECVKLEKKYGTVAGPLYDYLLELCPQVRKEFPELMISTLAYRKRQSEVPPSGIAKMPDNWICDFAPVDDDQGQALDGERNLDTLKNLQKWQKIAKNITYWYYLCINTAPFGLVERLSRDMKLMYENGVRGIGVCGLASPGMYPMQEYLLMRLMIDPYQDPWPIVEEYNRYMYGSAAPEMTAYVKELEEVWREPKKYVGLIGPGSDIMNYTPLRLVRWQAMFDTLEKKLAGQSRELGNLSLARWDLDMMTLDHYARIKEKYPEWTMTPDQIIERLRQVALPKRYDIFHMKVRAENTYLVCKAAAKPIPSPLDLLPSGQVIQLPQCGGHFNVIDPDAVCGQAKSQPFRKGQMEKSGKKIGFDFYDNAEKKTLSHGTIDASHCSPGKYELYFVGKTRIPRGGFLALDSWWGISVSLAPYYPEGDEFREFEVWASLKFVGPSFDKNSKETQDRMSCDRFFLVDRNAGK